MGKTHLCRGLATSPDHYFDLERSDDLVRLSDNALSILGSLTGRVVIDEAQELPALFKALRVLADRPDSPARFIVTGSVSPSLLGSVSESLAGRASIIEIGGFDLEETGPGSWEQLWLRGLVGQPDGGLLLRAEARAPRAAAEQLGVQVAEQLLAQGAADILKAVYGEAAAE